MAEDGDGGLGAHAHTDELDLGEQVAVAAFLLAHHPLQLCEAAEVFDLLDGVLVAHARVPCLVGFDEADAAAAGGGDVGFGDAGRAEEVGTVAGGEHGAHVGARAGEGGFEGGVGLCGVVGRDGVVEGEDVRGAGSVSLRGGGRESGGVDGDAEEVGEARDTKDGVEVEVRPFADLANVPPAVLGGVIAGFARAGRDGVDRWVGGGEVGQH